MKAILALIVIAVLILGLLWMQGTFDPTKVGPGSAVDEPEKVGGLDTAPVVSAELPILSEAVGTVRSRHSTRVSPRIMGTLLAVPVSQGDTVEKGDLIARIDDREVRAQVAVAKAALAQAEARHDQAAAAYRRYQQLFARGATTEEQLESVTGDYETAKAAMAGAAESVKAAEIVLGYAEIRSPISGVVSEKLAEPGDLALPGRPLVIIQDPGDLRLEANVREYLIPHLAVGAQVEVAFGPPLDERLVTTVEERAPEADPATRTFLVKAPLPEGSRARPGNFGRLVFRTGEREVILVPAVAVRRVGQLETVKVVADGRVLTRHLRTGRAHGDKLEVLSGLSVGEQVVLGRP
jgi:RND family efflux transporter MFP subunit